MKRVKRAMQKLLHPPAGVMGIVPLLSFAALIAVFAHGNTGSLLTYLIYGMSAYSLVILLAALPGADKAGKICYDG